MSGPRLWLIDAGNSVIKASRYADGRVYTTDRFPRPDWAEIGPLEELFDVLGRTNPTLDGVACCCARGEDEQYVARLAALLAKEDPVFARHDGPLPFTFVYTSGQPGPDRLANAAGLLALAPESPAIAIDFGTATHVETIDGEGRFAGGIILPGIGLQFDSLPPATRGRLPKLGPTAAARVQLLNNSTEGAIQSGILIGQAALADRAATMAREELDCIDAPVFLTGGGAELIASLMSIQARHEPMLTAIGLAEIWKHERKG